MPGNLEKAIVFICILILGWALLDKLDIEDDSNIVIKAIALLRPKKIVDSLYELFQMIVDNCSNKYKYRGNKCF